MSVRTARTVGPRLTIPQPNPPPAVGHAGSERILASAHDVDIDQLEPDPGQPRKYMHPERLAELAASIVAHGLLQPLLVRPRNFSEQGDMRYTIIAGGRRYAALRRALQECVDETQRARLRRVPVVVRSTEHGQSRVLQLIENLQREDLPPIEEARALRELMELEGLAMRGLAIRVNRSLGYVDERLRLLRHAEVTRAVEEGTITKSTGAAIASLPASEDRQAWLARASSGEAIQPAEIYASKRQKYPAGTAETGVDFPSQPEPPTGQTTGTAAEDERSDQMEPPPLPMAPQAKEMLPAVQNLDRHTGSLPNDAPAVPLELASEPVGDQETSPGRQARIARPTFLRLGEIDAALRNLSLDQASNGEEALAWLIVLRRISERVGRLCAALERLAGEESAAVLSLDSGVEPQGEH